MRDKPFDYNEWALNISRKEFNKLSKHEQEQVLRARERAEEVAIRKGHNGKTNQNQRGKIGKA